MRRLAGWAAAACVALAGRTAEGAGVTARLVPSVDHVAAGATFDVEVLIEAGEAWNGYELALVYDPLLVSRVTMDAAHSEGALMTEACAQRWHRLDETSGRLVLSHALLCPGARVTGPGQVYVFRFQSVGPQGDAVIGLEDVRFLDAGRELAPIDVQGASVRVGTNVAVEPTTWGRIRALYSSK